MIIAEQVWPPVTHKTPTGYHAVCPAHRDPQGSLHVLQESDGFVLLRCFAGCSTIEVAKASGLKMADLFGGRSTEHTDARRAATKQAKEERIAKAVAKGKTRMQNAPKERPPLTGCTLEEYARAKNLDIDLLRHWGLREIEWTLQEKGATIPVIEIPYHHQDIVRYRVGMKGDKFRWTKGAKPCPYGLWRLPEFSGWRRLILVEGESDCHLLWQMGYQAIGIPGANSWSDEFGPMFTRFAKVCLMVEPDKGGETLTGALTASCIGRKVRKLTLGRYKDPCELWAAFPSPETFKGLMDQFLKEAPELLINAPAVTTLYRDGKPVVFHE